MRVRVSVVGVIGWTLACIFFSVAVFQYIYFDSMCQAKIVDHIVNGNISTETVEHAIIDELWPKYEQVYRELGLEIQRDDISNLADLTLYADGVKSREVK